MAKQDNFVRMQLRMPAELHRRLVERAGAGSLNTRIVDRLEASLRAEMAADPSVLGALLRQNLLVERMMSVLPASESPVVYEAPPPSRRSVAVDWGELEGLIEKSVRKVLSERSDERPERRATVTVTARREHAKA